MSLGISLDTNLNQIASLLSSHGASKKQIEDVLERASGPNPQRALNQVEKDIFAGAVARAVRIMPAFRDAVAMIRPFKDYTTPTLYTDRYSRVGMGELFFLDGMSSQRRATLLLHETMHVLNNHFTRLVDFPIDGDSDNSAKDLEINSLLSRDPRTDLTMLLLPDQEPFGFPEAKSYEQYAKLMKDKGLIPEESYGQPDGGSEVSSEDSSNGNPPGDPQGGGGDESPEDSNGQASEPGEETSIGNLSSKGLESPDAGEAPDNLGENTDSKGSEGVSQNACDHSTSEREKSADEIGIERASSSEQSVVRNNTSVRLREEAAKAKERGDRAGLAMLQQMEIAMGPSKVNWRIILRNLLTNSRDSISMGRSDYSYRRVNKRLSSGDFIFPGMVKYEPSSMLGIDTSGSMTKKELQYILSEIEAIIRSAMRSKDKFRAFCVDAAATEPKIVRSLEDIDLRGGGGTRMEIAIKSVELLPRKDHPDLLIVATDGGTSWPAFKKELLKMKGRYKILLLITETNQFEVAKEELHDLADVIDISDK